ncbi:hypothetical protein [Haloferula sp. BvORR071]|uniref:hypothetical protein n=1 Tax=Haloferula sp. BvORR071 TaxID=1396141 RepID=UPI00054FDC09|nr:hypothetical protein [Haloferula sp. BvORR071]
MKSIANLLSFAVATTTLIGAPEASPLEQKPTEARFHASSQVRPIPISGALQFTLSNYYDLLKLKVGSLNADEFVQLKLVADPVDLSARYKYYSMYGLLNRSDLSVEPEPVSGTIVMSSTKLNEVYGTFMDRLRRLAIVRELDHQEQAQVAHFTLIIQECRTRMKDYQKLERKEWLEHCEAYSVKPGDQVYYLQWSVNNGYQQEISREVNQINDANFEIDKLLARKYADPADEEIVKADRAYRMEQMRLRWPMFPDFLYTDGDKFTLDYLARLPAGSTGLFDDRRTTTWNMAIDTIKTTPAGGFDVFFNRTTSKSNQMDSDWGTSVSASYFVVSANCSAEEQIHIAEDFRTMTELKLGAKAAFKVSIVYPAWFQPNLFNNKRVLENKREFMQFLGPKGSLLYYPTGLILIRGFSASFKNSQKWEYDYKRHFSAAAGGGFSVFGVGFGAKGSYENDTKEHQVDQADTQLSFQDGDETIRFAGYVVKKHSGFNLFEEQLPISEPGPNANALKEPFKGEP